MRESDPRSGHRSGIVGRRSHHSPHVSVESSQATAPVSRSALETADELERLLARVATALYALDSSGDTLFARARADAGDEGARAVMARLTVAWDDYSRAKAAVDALRTAMRAGDQAGANHLLGPAAVTSARGADMAIFELIGGVGRVVSEVGAEVTGVAELARRTMGRLDGAMSAARDLEHRAGALAAGGDPELDAVRAALDHATAAVAGDPTAAPELDTLEQALERARLRVEELQRQRDGLPTALVDARRLLERVEGLAREGAEGLARAQQKIAAPVGLRQALDPRSEGEQGLRPWLARIEDQAGAGDWQGAAGALVTWRRAAEDWEARVAQVAEANRGPVARRDQLRGLLAAYRAKASALGHAEDGRLDALHGAARDALYTAPCDLPGAERLVRAYQDAVNTAVAARR